MPIGLAGPARGYPGRRALELEHLRTSHRADRANDLDRWRGADLGGSNGNQLEWALVICIAVAVLVRLVETFCELRAERDRQLERLPRVAEVCLALSRQLTR